MTIPEPMTPMEPLRTPPLRAYGATDTGRQRDHNEDRFFCDAERGLFIVIDGVGGHAAGDVAADLAHDLVSMRLRFRSGTTEQRLRKAIITANKAIFFQGHTRPEQYGMACVLTAAVVEEDRVTVGHVGDTRLYEVRKDSICKITKDHSLVGIREDRGEISEWEAMTHPRRNEILRDLGTEWHELGDHDFIDLYSFPYNPEAALILCSDGLTDLVPSTALYQTMIAHAGDPERAVAELLDLANRAGGKDNITVIVVMGERFAEGVPRASFTASFAMPPEPVVPWWRRLWRRDEDPGP